MNDRLILSDLLGVQVSSDFPNQPVREFVLPNTVKALMRDPDVGRWGGMIVHIADAIVIGSMGFKSPPDADGTVEIGYDIVPNYQGYGYATEMAQAMIHWAFCQSNVNRVTAECFIVNRPSVRVLEKVGMKQVSQSKDMIYWEITK